MHAGSVYRRRLLAHLLLLGFPDFEFDAAYYHCTHTVDADRLETVVHVVVHRRRVYTCYLVNLVPDQAIGISTLHHLVIVDYFLSRGSSFRAFGSKLHIRKGRPY